MSTKQIEHWSTVDSSNTQADRSGMPEGMARSDVNNRGREHMAAIRTWYEDAEWVDLVSGWLQTFSISRVNDTTFRASDVAGNGTNASGKFPAGSWVKLTFASSGDFYGSIVSSTYSAPNTDVVLTEIVNASYASATLPDESITSAKTYSSRRIRSAAFSKTGTTASQTPPQIPTIDDINGLIGNQSLSELSSKVSASGNLIINGEFRIWQRGAIGPSEPYKNNNNTYCADRWVLLAQGDNQYTPSIGDGSDGGTNETLSNPVVRSAGGALRLKSESGGTNKKAGILQILEEASVNKVRETGKVSLGFYAKVSTGATIGNVRFAILRNFPSVISSDTRNIVSAWGAEGASIESGGVQLDSGIQVLAQGTGALTNSWQRFELENATLDASTSDQALGVFIWIDDTTHNSGDELHLSKVQLEPYSASTDGSVRPISEEIRECQRFFVKSTNIFENLNRDYTD